jgi:acyl-CoA dehydrogenase
LPGGEADILHTGKPAQDAALWPLWCRQVNLGWAVSASAGAASLVMNHLLVGVSDQPVDDSYLFNQGSAAGLSKIGFHDPRPAFARFADLPNVAVFLGQMQDFADLVTSAGPNADQTRDLDFLQVLGQLFTQVVYAQLVCEAAALALDSDGVRAGGVSDLTGLSADHVDRIFAVFVQDFSDYALQLHGQASASDEQRAAALKLIAAPRIDAAREKDFVAEVLSYDGAYVMNP